MPGRFHYFKGDKEFLVLGQIYKEEQRKGRFSGGQERRRGENAIIYLK